MVSHQRDWQLNPSAVICRLHTLKIEDWILKSLVKSEKSKGSKLEPCRILDFAVNLNYLNTLKRKYDCDQNKEVMSSENSLIVYLKYLIDSFYQRSLQYLCKQHLPVHYLKWWKDTANISRDYDVTWNCNYKVDI